MYARMRTCGRGLADLGKAGRVNDLQVSHARDPSAGSRGHVFGRRRVCAAADDRIRNVKVNRNAQGWRDGERAAEGPGVEKQEVGGPTLIIRGRSKSAAAEFG